MLGQAWSGGLVFVIRIKYLIVYNSINVITILQISTVLKYTYLPDFTRKHNKMNIHLTDVTEE